MKPRKLTCLVAMPFGKKRVQTSVHPDHFEWIDFDDVYRNLFKPALECLGIDPERVDVDGAPGGNIDDSMWQMIAGSDLCLIDITGNNPNVFYELGVRHALHKSGSLIVRLKSKMPRPFDIARIDITAYDLASDITIASSTREISTKMAGKANDFDDDSPVRRCVKGLSVSFGRTKSTSEPFTHRLIGHENRFIGIMPGDIRDVKGVDAWVNSENTHMEMARHYDRSISGTIRYLGAQRSSNGDIKRDQIEINLRRAVRNKRGERLSRVDAGKVFDTGAGALTESHDVKRLFHVATVQGEAGVGYVPVGEAQACLTNVLAHVAAYNARKSPRNKLRSILVPLFGTGSGRRPPEDVVDLLLGAAIRHLKLPETHGLETIWFLAYSKFDEGLCLRGLGRREDEFVSS